MKKFLCILGFVFLALGVMSAEQSNEQPKIIYVKIADSKDYFSKSFYIGQTVDVTYNLLLFSNARFSGTEFVGGLDRKKITLRNPNVKWKLSSDGSYQAVYKYKINSLNATIPPLRVVASSSDGSYLDSSVAPAIKLNVIDLFQNPKYAGVVADSLVVLGYKAKSYDGDNNILVFELQGKNSNLEDFKLPNTNIQKQGFESKHFGGDDSDGIYYCIVPKEMQNLSFEFFSLENNHFRDISIPIVPVDDMVSTQDDVKPKNNFLLFSNIILIVLVVISLLCYFVFKRKKIFLIIFVILLAYLLWNIFSRHQAVLLAGKNIRILPTYNSTILETTNQNIQVEVIGKHGKYYKILTEDDKIGWVKKSDVK